MHLLTPWLRPEMQLHQSTAEILVGYNICISTAEVTYSLTSPAMQNTQALVYTFTFQVNCNQQVSLKFLIPMVLKENDCKQVAPLFHLWDALPLTDQQC